MATKKTDEFECECFDEIGPSGSPSVIPCAHYIQSNADKYSIWCVLCGHTSVCHEQFALLMSGRA